jgi:hypothetical protein
MEPGLRATTPSDEVRPRDELDSAVVTVEFTLISIVQGVALYFLTDSSRQILADLRWSALPYVVSATTLILAVWSRSLLHAFTVIRWPLELGHNFFYVIVTLVESTLFTQIGNPQHWFPMSTALITIFWVMFFYERRLYRARRADSAGPSGLALLELLEREHELNLRLLVPINLVLCVVMSWLVISRPTIFIQDGWHVALGSVQALGLLIYLALVWRFYLSAAPRVVAARAEWERPGEAPSAPIDSTVSNQETSAEKRRA